MSEALILTPENWGQMKDIQWRSQEIDYKRDKQKYGKREHWAIPEGETLEGDCEDSCLWCSEELIKIGIGWDYQSIFYVKLGSAGHAVLAVTTHQGTYCFDINEDQVVPYDRIKERYEVVSQSVQGGSLAEPWHKIAP